ncbi:hypothetical protein HAP32_04886 [Serratia fonticola]|nr:hypothetical protein HAP32_04886 [Serratia fonticola]
MNIKDNGLFKFDYQFPVYNFFSRIREKVYHLKVCLMY